MQIGETMNSRCRMVVIRNDAGMEATLCDFGASIYEIRINDKPMTIIYPGAMGLAPNVIAEDGSAGIRIPMNDFCVEVIRRFRKPIVSTSANISGEPAPAFYEDIPLEIIDAVDWVADPYLEEGATGEASQIIQVGLDGQIKIIRK